MHLRLRKQNIFLLSPAFQYYGSSGKTFHMCDRDLMLKLPGEKVGINSSKKDASFPKATLPTWENTCMGSVLWQ